METKKIKLFKEIKIHSIYNKMRNNFIFTNNIKTMSRSELYREAKVQAQELGYDVETLRARWRGSTTAYWRTQVQGYMRNIRNRTNNYNRALRVARELRENLSIPNRLNGSSNEDWIRELRRLRMRGRRGQQAQPILRAIAQPPEQRRQQQRARQLQAQLQAQVQRRQQQAELERLINNNNFQRVLNIIINDNRTLNNQQAQRLWNNIIGSGRYVIYIEGEGIDQYLPMNNTTRDFILNIFTNGIIIDRGAPNWGSDIVDNMTIQNINRMTIQRVNPQRVIRNRDGRFFPHINTSDLDLSKYQIYNQEQAYEDNTHKKRQHCLIHTLEQQGISKTITNSIKMSYIKGVNIRKKDLHNIAKMINRNIYVYTKNGGRIAIQKIKGRKVYEEPPPKEQLDREHEEFMKEFNEGLEETDIKINEKELDEDHKKHTEQFNIICRRRIEEEKKPDIHIAMYENHYFTYEDTKYSKYSIIHYDELKDEEDFHNIIKKQIIKGKAYIKREADKSKINSLLLVDKFKEQGKFKKLDLVKFEEASSHKETRDHIYLDNIDNEQRLCGEKKEEKTLGDMGVNRYTEEKKVIKAVEKLTKEKPKPDIYYADCETFVKDVKDHELYLLGCVGDKSDWVDIYNVMDNRFTPKNDCSSEQLVIYQWLKDMSKGGKNNVLCYYHNLKYDYHILEQYLNIKDRCEKDGQLYSVKCVYKGKEIELRDSYKLLPFALSKFGGEFDLPKEIRKKEAIAYDYYTRENNDKVIPAREYRSLLSSKEKVIFKDVMKNEPTYNINNKTFNPLEYYKEYLRLDCLVLKKGIQKFDQLIKEITENKMSVYESLTISSLTDKYMKIEGAYDGVYEVQGNLRAYIAEAVYGGRVCVNKKYKKKVIKGKISDYDGVSLYPSAINRLCRLMGLPIGKAKRFNQNDLTGLNNSFWKDKTYSIMTVKITKVNKKQQMPFIAQKEEGSIKYINTPPDKPIIIDSITLEDYIKFHEIEYELLEGVYWNEGGNKKMGEVIQRLFNARLQYKTTNKALANTIKLMLNSSYGKTIMKKSKCEKVIVKTQKYTKQGNKWIKEEKTNLQNYIYNNFNTIKDYRKLNEDVYEIERIKADNSFNRGHIGCAILSTSKRIMNEVFNVANDNEYPIYYTDTDSLHCNMEDVPKLEEKYKERYNKELNGKQLEQFHTDFDLEGAKDEIYAVKSIFLGKKSYMDYLESKDENGNTITGYHIRLKGITKEGLDHEAKKYNNSYLGLYEDLTKGKEIEIVLNPFNKEENKQKVLFDFKDGKVSTKNEFKRKVKF